MHFAQADNLWLLFIPGVMVVCWALYLRWRKGVVNRIGDRSLVLQMAAQFSVRAHTFRTLIFLVAVTLLIVAAARPQWGETGQPLKRSGVDIVFALDLSNSMLAEDIAPNRLDAAKEELLQTLAWLQGDRVGLVVFTGISFAQSPLTSDYSAIRFYLRRLHPSQMPVGGTSLGRAMTDSLELLTGRGLNEAPKADDAEMVRAREQLIVLLTDGEDHESDPLATAELVARHGVRVVTVAIGSTEGGRVPRYDENGNLTGYIRDAQGEVVITRVDEETLRKIATATDGAFLRYEGSRSVARQIVEFVQDLEKTQFEALIEDRYEDRYLYFAIPGFLLLLLALISGSRQHWWRRRRIVGVAIILSLLGCDTSFERPYPGVERGKSAHERQEYATALEEFERAEDRIGTRAELHFNRGLAHFQLEDYESARAAFARALEARDPVLRFDALTHLGLALARLERFKESYDSFLEALSYAVDKPEIDEARLDEARHNLEVAWRRLFPPCSTLEDEFEPNDSIAEATPLTSDTLEGLTLCGLNDDFYAIPVLEGSLLSVEARFRDLRENPDLERAFLPQPPDLQIALFDAAGDVLIVDQGLDQEPTQSRRAQRKIERYRVEDPGDSPVVFLKVSAAEYLEFQYDLKFSVIPPCHALEEELEPNDSVAQAAAIEPGTHAFHICPSNPDYFAVNVQEGDTVFVDLRPGLDQETESVPQLTFRLLDERGNVITDAVEEFGLKTVGVRNIPHDGKVILEVIGADEDTQGPYEVEVFHYPPCDLDGAGNDRYEPNDDILNATALDPTLQVHRYLRLCEMDVDHYRIATGDPEDDDPDKERSISMGIAKIAFVDDAGIQESEIFLESIDEDGQVLEEGVPIVFEPGPEIEDEDEEAALMSMLHRALIVDEVEEEEALLRVYGAPDFYHLVHLNPQDPPQDPEDQDQDQDQDQDDDGEGDGEDEEESQDDSQDEDADEEEDAGEQSQRDVSEDPRMDRYEEILRALEEIDDNIQMKKALENIPNRYIEKDW